VAKQHKIKIDDEAFHGLRREFGSIGNALHFLYQGIKDFREAYGLEAPRAPVFHGKALKRERFIDKTDIRALIPVVEDALRELYLDGGDEKALASVLDKLQSALYQR
jgi:hypothetical protein